MKVNSYQSIAEMALVLTNAGFSVCDTGGGCTAWRLNTPNGGYCLITSAEGCDHEVSASDPPIIGFYDADGDQLFALIDGELN